MSDTRAAGLVLVSVPSAEVGDRIARDLVEESLAGCVTRLPGARSTYRWEGAVETATEEILLIKTTLDRWPALRDRVAHLHPYEVPEILLLPIDGAPAYLSWLVDCCHPAGRP